MYNINVLKHPDEYRKLEVLEDLNLNKINVLIEDTAEFSDYFNVIDLPSEISLGKYSFVVDPPPDLLKLNSQIKVELRDSSGKLIPVVYPKSLETIVQQSSGNIYVEENYASDGYKLGTTTGRNVQIIVYDDVADGVATLYIVGEAKKNKLTNQDIPSDWRGVYNVRWSKTIIIDKSKKNSAPILFYQQPSASINEFVSNYRELISDGNLVTTTTGNVSLESTKNNSIIPTCYIKASGFSFNDGFVGNYVDVPSPTNINKINSFGQEPLQNRLSRLDASESASLRHVVPANETPDSGSSLYRYYAKILKVINSSTAIAEFYVKNFSYKKTSLPSSSPEVSFDVPYYSFDNSPATMSYYSTESKQTTVQSTSYINLKLENLRTLSGQVNKIKVLWRSLGYSGEYNLLSDKLIENQTLLVDNNNVDLGRFPASMQSQYTTLFLTQSYSISGTTISVNSSNDLSLVSGSDVQLHALKITPTGSVLDTLTNFYKLTHNKSVTFDNEVTYELSLNLYGRRTATVNSASIDFYFSGSAFAENNTKGLQFRIKNTQNIFGKNIFSKRLYGDDVLKDPSLNDIYNYGKLIYKFKPNFDGTGKLVIVLNGKADWYVNNIVLNTKIQKGFSPSTYNLILSNPSKIRSDKLDFKIEFVNPEEERATTYILTSQTNPVGTNFDGENTVITNDDNLVPGSLFLYSGSLYTGVQISGKAGGFITSVGYKGYTSASLGTGAPGFIIYSGSSGLSSVLTASDNYDGVGFELHAGGNNGRMRFKASGSNSIFEVVAKSFFVGTSSVQYISGSGGKIEISSSNFFLSSSGNVFINGTVTATTGSIGGWIIKPDSIAKGTVTMSSAGEYIKLGSATSTMDTGSLSGTGVYLSGSGQFRVGDATNYIVFSGSRLFIKSSDIDITASSVNINTTTFVLTSATGGKFIAGATAQTVSFGDTSAHTYISGSGDFEFVYDANNFIRKSGSSFRLSSQDFTLSTTQLRINTSSISLGATLPTSYTNGTGVFISSSGQALIGNSTANRIQFDGSNLILSSSTFMLGSLTGAYISASGTNLILSSSTFKLGSSGAFISSSGTDLILSSSTFKLGSSTSFISSSGTDLILSSSTFRLGGSGTFISSTGTDLILSSSTFKIGGSTAFISSSGTGLIISSSNFYVDASGNITASNAKLSGNITASTGSIGGWDITSTHIAKTSVTMSSAGEYIKLGSATSHTAGNGVFLSGSGVVLIGSSSANRIQFDGTNLILSSSTFKLGSSGAFISSSGTDLILSSSTFKLGSSTSFISSSGTDLILSSSTFRLGGSGTFISSTGTDLILSSSTFKIGGSTAFISSSGTGLIISSSNFYVDASGNITASNAKLSGNITASTGSIGGWIIGSTFISSSTATYSIVLNSSAPSIYIGAGTYNNANTPFFVSGSGQFSLGDKLFFSGSILTVSGTISASAGYFSGSITSVATMSGGQFVGGIIKTATENDRIELNGADNRLKFYYGGNLISEIYAINTTSTNITNVRTTYFVVGRQNYYISSTPSPEAEILCYGSSSGNYFGLKMMVATSSYSPGAPPGRFSSIVAFDQADGFVGRGIQFNIDGADNYINLVGNVGLYSHNNTFQITGSTGDLVTVGGMSAASYPNYILASDGSVFKPIATASWAVSASNVITASYIATASWARNAVTSSYILNAVSASYVLNAVSASYVLNAVSASYVPTSSWARNLVTAYGSLYNNDTPTTITCNNSSPFYVSWSGANVTGSDLLNTSYNTTQGAIYVGAGYGGYYLINYTVSYSSSVASTDYIWSIAVNDTYQDKSRTRATYASGQQSISGNTIVSCSDSAKISIGVNGNTGNIVYVSYLNLTINKLS